jgi:tRNA(adenine34) deaminase
VAAAAVDDTMLMRAALRSARAAAARGEVPVGAVAAVDGRIIASAGNRVERGSDATLHAEMIVLRRAARLRGGWRLSGVTLAVTLEPCPMCAGAMLLTRIDRCVYGAIDPRKGADVSAYTVLRSQAGNHHPDVAGGVLADECGALLSAFFRELRPVAPGVPTGAGG